MKSLEKKIQLLFNLFRSKKIVEAKQLNKDLIYEYPKNAFLYNTLGLIFSEEKNFNEAILTFNKGIKINPDFAPLYNNIGNVYRIKKIFDKAQDYFKKSISLDTKNPEPKNNLGNLFLELNNNEGAIYSYNQAINDDPKFFPSHYNLGIAYKNIGNFEKSKKHLNETINLKPFFFPAHRTLSQIIKYKKNDTHLKLLKKIYNDKKIKNINKTELLFALGKASEDIKDYINAFKFFKEANNIHRKYINFSISDVENKFDNIKKVFNKNFFSKSQINGNNNSTPIFIVGMPRSGTTLVEQILSSHPDVFGGDELNFIPDLIKKYFIKEKDFFNINEEISNKMSEEYISRVRKLSYNSQKVTDKLPINFMWLGLIKIILPKAKIVHCTRNPKDNCLSIFKNYFTNPQMNFAYNIDEILKFYNLYSDLMKHWSSQMLNSIYEMNYEKLIENPKLQITRLLKSCDLHWDDRCLKFYNNKRAVKTVSDSQVRKKLYKSSMNSWMNYKKNLESKFKKFKI